MITVLGFYSFEQQFSNLRVPKNCLGDDIYLRYIGYQEEQARGRCLNSAAHVKCEKAFLASTLKGKELNNREDRNLPNVIP